jgi:ATP-dependent RNA helicase DHX29
VTDLYFGGSSNSGEKLGDFSDSTPTNKIHRTFTSTTTYSPRTPRANTTSCCRHLKMAGGKKKKKPAANPARAVATTSIVSKSKVEVLDVEATPPKELQDAESQQTEAPNTKGTGILGPPQKDLTPEEFERQLENSELQVLVEKHAQKSKRDAQRQKTRLETDRRVLRGQAESLSTRKWLPPELMEEILDLLKSEGRFTGQTVDVSSSLKPPSEEELTIKLWTLQQALVGAGFLEDKVSQALKFVLDISDKIGVGNKDAIWGMEEALEWLSRECERKELPDYENWQRKQIVPKMQNGKSSFFAFLVLSRMLTAKCRNSF